jgi:hypothetical protein
LHFSAHRKSPRAARWRGDLRLDLAIHSGRRNLGHAHTGHGGADAFPHGLFSRSGVTSH